MEKTAPQKHKGRRLEFFEHKIESSSEESSKHNREKHQDSSEISDSNQNKNKYKSYEEIYGKFNEKKPLFFIERSRKGKKKKIVYLE